MTHLCGFFVKYIVCLTFLILAQSEKIVNSFWKKYLYFLYFRVIIKYYSFQSTWFLLKNPVSDGLWAPHQKQAEKVPVFPIKSRFLPYFHVREKFIFPLKINTYFLRSGYIVIETDIWHKNLPLKKKKGRYHIDRYQTTQQRKEIHFL